MGKNAEKPEGEKGQLVNEKENRIGNRKRNGEIVGAKRYIKGEND